MDCTGGQSPDENHRYDLEGVNSIESIGVVIEIYEFEFFVLQNPVSRSIQSAIETDAIKRTIDRCAVISLDIYTRRVVILDPAKAIWFGDDARRCSSSSSSASTRTRAEEASV